MITTPVSLLEQLRRPDEQAAWVEFVRLYGPLLFYWARKAGLQESDAADLTQEVFAVLVQKLPEFRYDEHKSFRAWLRTIALNKWRDGRRRRARLPAEIDGSGLDDVPEPDESFTEQEYRRQLMTQALEILRPEFRPATWKAFEEHGVAGRRAEDVARDLGMTVGGVYAAKFRVLARLRNYLQGLLE
jgi:RNA polymerase sigma-70 factor (ECF subfamily)